MAMTKKEAAAMQAAIDRAEMLAALRWTEPVQPDVPAPAGGTDATTHGWQAGLTPERSWSQSFRHGRGEGPGLNRTGSQNAVSLYSTELLALRAARHRAECDAAQLLLKFDRRIAELTKTGAA